MSPISQSVLRKVISLSLVLLFAVIFSVTTTSFFTWTNICSIMREVSVIGLLSMGVTFVIIGGGIDLSTGAVLGLSAMVTSHLVTDTYLPIWLIIVLALILGLGCGLVNGLLITKLHLNDFIATFATMFVFRGLVYTLSYRSANGAPTTVVVRDKYFAKVGGTIGGFYYMSIVWIAVFVIGYIVLKKTKFGTYIYACGTNRKSAAFTGINVNAIKIATNMICSCLCALAGVFLLAWQGSVALDTGSGMEFKAIAACVVGGIYLAGGRGDTIGTAIGSIFMIMVVNALYKYGLSTQWQTIAYGLIIIIMAVFDAVYFKMMDKRLQKSLKKTAVE